MPLTRSDSDNIVHLTCLSPSMAKTLLKSLKPAKFFICSVSDHLVRIYVAKHLKDELVARTVFGTFTAPRYSVTESV